MTTHKHTDRKLKHTQKDHRRILPQSSMLSTLQNFQSMASERSPSRCATSPPHTISHKQKHQQKVDDKKKRRSVVQASVQPLSLSPPSEGTVYANEEELELLRGDIRHLSRQATRLDPERKNREGSLAHSLRCKQYQLTEILFSQSRCITPDSKRQRYVDITEGI